MKRIIVTYFITIILGFNEIKSQSSDNLNYVFLYDISGSTHNIDKKNHLATLLYNAIRKKGNSIESGFSFDIVFFGAETSIANSLKFDLSKIQSNALKTDRKLINGINNSLAKSKHQNYTHLHSALEYTNNEIKNVDGIFIITDGQLLNKDVNTAELKTSFNGYINSIEDEIASIKEKNIPVFFIQSSFEPGMPYFNNGIPININKDSLYISDKLFWVRNYIKNTDIMTDAFEKFMAQAHHQIITRHNKVKTESLQKAAVPVMVLVNDIYNLKIRNIDSLMNNLNKTEKEKQVAKQLKSILNMLKSSKVSSDSILIFKSLIDSLSDKTEQLSRIYNSLNKNKETKYLVTSYKNILATTDNKTLVPEVKSSIVTDDFENAIVKGLAEYIIKRSKKEAIYLLLENLKNNVNLAGSFFADTLFYNTTYYLNNNLPQTDLLLIREALNKDLNDFHLNLILYQKLEESENLIGLAYGYELVKQLISTGQLELAFAKLSNIKLVNVNSTVQRGVLLTASLIKIVEDNNLPTAYINNPEKLEALSREFLLYYSVCDSSFSEIEFEHLTKEIKDIYITYVSIKNQIEDLQKIPPPQNDYMAYKQYRREIMLDIINNSIELMLSGIHLTTHYLTNDEIVNEELRKKAASTEKSVTATINSWFLVRDKEYIKATMLLIPILEEVLEINPNLTEYATLEFSELRENKKIKNLKNQKILFNEKEILGLEKFLKDYNNVEGTLEKFNNEKLLDTIYINRLSNFGLSRLSKLISKSSNGKHYVVDLSDYQEAVRFLRNSQNPIAQTRLKGVIKKYKNDKFNPGFAFQFMEFNGLNENILKLVKVGAELSTTTSAEGVTNVLSNYALPTASYKIKRKNKWSFMINAYAGIGGSYYTNSENFRINISAPLGLEVSHAIWQKMSISLLAAPIDIGNVINYQIIGDDNKSDEEVFTFENIYSPSLFFVFGLSNKNPFSIGIGHQWNDTRWSLFASFDLPIFRIK